MNHARTWRTSATARHSSMRSSESRWLPLPYTSSGNPVTYNSSISWFYGVENFVLLYCSLPVILHRFCSILMTCSRLLSSFWSLKWASLLLSHSTDLCVLMVVLTMHSSREKLWTQGWLVSCGLSWWWVIVNTGNALVWVSGPTRVWVCVLCNHVFRLVVCRCESANDDR
jgi:hypothetical protein